MESGRCRNADDHQRKQLAEPSSSCQTVYFFFFLFFSIYPLPASSQDPYLLSCGSSSDTLLYGRSFIPDSSRGTAFYSFSGNSIVITNPNPRSGISALYNTARVFKSPSTYDFAVSGPATYFVRLHFSPFATPGYDLSSPQGSGFQVTTMEGSVLLLGGSTMIHPSTYPPMVKEYLLWIPTSKLSISFIPAAGVQGSFAYVNAIEVFRAPDFYMNERSPRVVFESVGGGSDVLWGTQAMEMVFRVNAGGPAIDPPNDGLHRQWFNDGIYLFDTDAAENVTTNLPILYPANKQPSRDFAPEAVYDSAEQMNKSMASNLTWRFAVGTGYKYLVRTHFCDFMSSGADHDSLYFNVYLSNRTGYADFHPASQRVPSYEDFVTDPDQLGVIFLSIGPSSNSPSGSAGNAILNGVEIWKVNNSNGSLDGPFDAQTAAGRGKGKWGPSKIALVVALSVVAAAFFVVLVATVAVLISRKKPRPQNAPPSRTTNPSSSHNLYMPLYIVKRCTRDFDDRLVIGQGAFGKVYRGKLRDGRRVAVKRAWEGTWQQGASQFHAEVRVLSQVSHPNLVSLLAFCDDDDELVLIYEYMEKGTLKDLLYPSRSGSGTGGSSTDRPRRPGGGSTLLSWQQRLNICIGAAKGLQHLHKELSLPVIHRDIKSTNILLGEHYVARLSDFGISKMVPSPDQTAVSTDIKGSFGYLDPEYCRTQRLTTKSDVYSFGVVLFEVLCARQALNPGLGRDEANLAEWATEAWSRGEVDGIVDQRLRGSVDPQSLNVFVDTAAMCVKDTGSARPDIEEVVRKLEHALRMHIRGDARPAVRTTVPPRLTPNRRNGAVMDDDYQFASNVMSMDLEGR